MATFTEIYYNGNEYKQMWLNGTKVWEKDSGGGEIVYPYSDADCVITYKNTSSKQTVTFDIIDSTLPYSINGVETNSYTFPSNAETKVKLINLKPSIRGHGGSYFYPISIEQMRIPNLTDLSELFYAFGYSGSCSWQPEYFEFHPNPTNMSKMFLLAFSDANATIATEMMAQLMPYFPNTSSVTDTSYMFDSACRKISELDLTYFDTSSVTTYSFMFDDFAIIASSNATIYITDRWTLSKTPSSFVGGYTTPKFKFELKTIPITSIDSLTCDVDVSNVTSNKFTIIPTITPRNYSYSDLVVTYDSTYMSTKDNKTFVLKDGCQGQTFDITYSKKSSPDISKTITITVSQDLEFPTVIDFTQSTAPTLPSYMTLDGGNSNYYFSHGQFELWVNGLVPNNSGKHSSVAYTRYKYIAPATGTLQFTYRCSSESGYDKLTIHVNTSSSQPSYSSSTDRVVEASGSTYKDTDGTASISVVGGTTYYIHIQYCKDSSSNSGYDKGCIRKIELL